MIALAPDKSAYRPQGNCRKVFTCQAREVLVEGPARTGKSIALLSKCYMAACKYPNSRSLLVRATRASMSQSVLQILEDDVLPKVGPWRSGPRRTHREQYDLPNGSVIVCVGMDHTQKVMSSEWDRVYVFEATELFLDQYEKLVTRLSGKSMAYAQIMADCNPAHPSHWLNQRAVSGNMDRICTTHKDNPRWWDEARGDWTAAGVEYVQNTLGRLTGHRRERLLLGRWSAAEGLVFSMFSPATHVLTAMPEGWQSWRKIRSIDFGYTNPFSCSWWAIDGDGRMYLYRQWYRAQTTVPEHAARIAELSQGEEYSYTVADSEDPEGIRIMAEHGVECVPARKGPGSVEAGIQAVIGRLNPAGDGKPRIFFLRSALVERDETVAEQGKPCSTIEELDSYLWSAVKDGKPVKESPIAVDDHGISDMRYAVMAEAESAVPIVVSARWGGRSNERGSGMWDRL